MRRIAIGEAMERLALGAAMSMAAVALELAMKRRMRRRPVAAPNAQASVGTAGDASPAYSADAS